VIEQPYGKAQHCPICGSMGDCDQTLPSFEPGKPTIEEWSCPNDGCPINGWQIRIGDVEVHSNYLSTPKGVKNEGAE